MQSIKALKQYYATIVDLKRAIAVLEWDQETYMPGGSTDSRANQIGTLTAIAHEKASSEKLGDLLQQAETELAGSVPNRYDAQLVVVGLRDYTRASTLPAEFVARFAKTIALAKDAWKAARANSHFATFSPHLETIVELNRQKAEYVGFEDHPYDALLDEFEHGLTTADVTEMFGELRRELVPMVESISSAPRLSDAIVRRHYPHNAQWDFGMQVLRDIGFDFAHGRQDVSTHPFTTSFSVTDVRITTRIDEHFFNPAFFGTLHEAGHGMYEQGVDRTLDRTPLADGTSLGIHESQSRMWENLIGRSAAFWKYYFPVAQKYFPEALADVDATEFYSAVNIVEPSLVRVEADEVTYNLHILIRFELEKMLFDGALKTEDIPEAWATKTESYLGLTPGSDAEGCLQDIHWSLGAFGYFPTYTLGNLMSAQLFEAMRRDLGDLDEYQARGDFAPMLGWLRKNVHIFGRTATADEIMKSATGNGLSAKPWLNYISNKFGQLYSTLN